MASLPWGVAPSLIRPVLVSPTANVIFHHQPEARARESTLLAVYSLRFRASEILSWLAQRLVKQCQLHTSLALIQVIRRRSWRPTSSIGWLALAAAGGLERRGVGLVLQDPLAGELAALDLVRGSSSSPSWSRR